MLFQLISIFIVLVIDCIQVNESLIKKNSKKTIIEEEEEG